MSSILQSMHCIRRRLFLTGNEVGYRTPRKDLVKIKIGIPEFFTQI